MVEAGWKFLLSRWHIKLGLWEHEEQHSHVAVDKKCNCVQHFRNYIWQTADDAQHSAKTITIMKHLKGCIMLWRVFSAAGTGRQVNLGRYDSIQIQREVFRENVIVSSLSSFFLFQNVFIFYFSTLTESLSLLCPPGAKFCRVLCSMGETLGLQ